MGDSIEKVPDNDFKQYYAKVKKLASILSYLVSSGNENGVQTTLEAGQKSEREQNIIHQPLHGFISWLTDTILRADLAKPRIHDSELHQPKLTEESIFDKSEGRSLVVSCVLLAFVELSEDQFFDLIDLIKSIINSPFKSNKKTRFKDFASFFSETALKNIRYFLDVAEALEFPESTLLDAKSMEVKYKDIFRALILTHEVTDLLIVFDFLQVLQSKVLNYAFGDFSEREVQYQDHAAISRGAIVWLSKLAIVTKELLHSGTGLVPTLTYFDKLIEFSTHFSHFIFLLRSGVLFHFPLQDFDVKPQTLVSELLTFLRDVEYHRDQLDGIDEQTRKEVTFTVQELEHIFTDLLAQLKQIHLWFSNLSKLDVTIVNTFPLLKKIHEYIAQIDVLDTLYKLIQNRIKITSHPIEDPDTYISIDRFLHLSIQLAEVPGLSFSVIESLTFYRRVVSALLQQSKAQKLDKTFVEEYSKILAHIDAAVARSTSNLLAHTWQVYRAGKDGQPDIDDFELHDMLSLVDDVLIRLGNTLFEGRTGYDRFLQEQARKSRIQKLPDKQERSGQPKVEPITLSKEWALVAQDPPLLVCLRRSHGANEGSENQFKKYYFHCVGINFQILFSIYIDSSAKNHDQQQISYFVDSLSVPDDFWKQVARKDHNLKPTIFDFLTIYGLRMDPEEFHQVMMDLITQHENNKSAYFRSVNRRIGGEGGESGDVSWLDEGDGTHNDD